MTVMSGLVRHRDGTENIPLRRNPLVINRFHPWDIEGNEPHGCCVKPIYTQIRQLRAAGFHLMSNSPGYRTPNGLSAPSLGITNISCTPQREWRNNPGPEEQPQDRRPPVDLYVRTQAADAIKLHGSS